MDQFITDYIVDTYIPNLGEDPRLKDTRELLKELENIFPKNTPILLSRKQAFCIARIMYVLQWASVFGLPYNRNVVNNIISAYARLIQRLYPNQPEPQELYLQFFLDYLYGNEIILSSSRYKTAHNLSRDVTESSDMSAIHRELCEHYALQWADTIITQPISIQQRRTSQHHRVCALFIDNDADNFQGYETVQGLSIMHIPETPRRLDAVAYYKTLVRKGQITLGSQPAKYQSVFLDGKEWEFGPGIQKRHLQSIQAWVDKNTRMCSNIKLFFDWDRTLSQSEGCDIRFFNEDNVQIFGAAYLSFLMGGRKRLETLSDFFRKLKQQPYGDKIEYYVITSNRYCTERDHKNSKIAVYFYNFLTMVRMVFGESFPEKNLICTTAYTIPFTDDILIKKAGKIRIIENILKKTRQRRVL